MPDPRGGNADADVPRADRPPAAETGERARADTAGESHERLEDPVEVEEQADTPPSGWAPPKGTRRATLIVVAIGVVSILIILYAWGLPPFRHVVEGTDNAYVRGQTTVISPQVSGYVVQVPVRDFQQVKAGDVLLKIDDRIYRQRVEQARANVGARLADLSNLEQTERSRLATVRAQEANVANAGAQLERAQADMRRVEELVADGSVSLRERDQTRAALRQAETAVRQARASLEIARQDVRAVDVNREGLRAAVEAARAALHLAEIDLANTVLRAPQGGQLSQIGARVGQYVTAGTQSMFLVPDARWVIANYKEAQTSHMAPGQPASFRVDGLDNARLTGRVEQLAPAAGSEFTVIQPDNATGNFVKVAQRISVRIAIDPDQPLAARLRPGMSVRVEVDTSGGRRRAP